MNHSPSEKRRGWHWTDYWQSGREDVMSISTPSGPVTFDTGTIWREWFASFPSRARLIDLATGSGQVAAYASAAAAMGGKTFDITGVDYAEVRPVVGYALLGGIALEKLPFPAAHFDGASSQFGIEYADTRMALSELSRILKPQGRALMLVHHSGSVITLQTAAQIAAYDKVMSSSAAIRQGRRAFSAHQKGLPVATIQAAEAAFRDAVRRAKDRLEPGSAFDPVRYLVGYIDDLASRVGSYEPASALVRLEAFEAGNSAWRHRQQSQTRAALDRAGLEAFVHRAAQSGLVLTEQAEEFDPRDELIGWKVNFRKS